MTAAPGAARALDATQACVHFAGAAGTVDIGSSDLGSSRQEAARAHGTPRLQAAFDGAGQGRDREQERWQQHRARVAAIAVPAAGGATDQDLDDRGVEPSASGTPVAVTVTGTARGTDGWTAAVMPYRVECLTVQDPVAGWLVDDVDVAVLRPAAG